MFVVVCCCYWLLLLVLCFSFCLWPSTYVPGAFRKCLQHIRKLVDWPVWPARSVSPSLGNPISYPVPQMGATLKLNCVYQDDGHQTSCPVSTITMRRLCACLPACLPARLPAYLPTYLPTCQPAWLLDSGRPTKHVIDQSPTCTSTIINAIALLCVSGCVQWLLRCAHNCKTHTRTGHRPALDQGRCHPWILHAAVRGDERGAPEERGARFDNDCNTCAIMVA